MLSNLLDKLGSLLSKYFVIGSFIPVLIFVCLNGALLYWNAVWFRAWVDPQLFGAKTGFFAGAMLIGLAVAAYVLSSVSVFLREVLEGKHVGPLLPKGLFENPQHEKRNRLDDQRRRAHEEADKIVEIRQKWPEILVHASREGAKNHQKGMRHDGELGAAVEVHKEGRILSTKG